MPLDARGDFALRRVARTDDPACTAVVPIRLQIDVAGKKRQKAGCPPGWALVRSAIRYQSAFGHGCLGRGVDRREDGSSFARLSDDYIAPGAALDGHHGYGTRD